jgi:phosphoglycolate phosphatase
VAELVVSAYRDRHAQDGLYDIEPIPGMSELIADLDAGGRTIAVATAKPLLQTDATLEHLGLRGHIAALGCASLDRSRIHKGDIIHAVLGDLDHPDPSDVVMVGDRATDVEGGRSHALGTIGVTWGFAGPGELDAARPDAIVTTVDGLRGALGA